jgi:dihydropteroate synthase
MAILNCTPDSFSDGGLFVSGTEAVTHALHMVDEGADIIDIGGESTRPGAQSVTTEEEIRRVVPVVTALRNRCPGTVLSVDTSKADVAAAALEAGADLINDVTGAADPEMLKTVVSAEAGIVLMHMRGRPRTMQDNPTYANAQAEVHAFLALRARKALEAGLPRDLVWLDPGIGFGKDDRANVRLLAALPDLAALGHPVVVGVSRKSLIGRLTGADIGDRLPGSLAALTPSVSLPQAVVRVHDVRQTLQFLKVLAAIEEAGR